MEVLFGKRLQDRAIRPVVALATVNQVLERGLHCLDLLELLLEFLDVRLGQRLQQEAGAIAWSRRWGGEP